MESGFERLKTTKLQLRNTKTTPWVLDGEPPSPPEPQTPNEWFCHHFTRQAEAYGSPFIELKEDWLEGGEQITPIDINYDFFAAALGGDKRLGHSVVYYEPEMQFYFFDVVDKFYKPTTPEKLQNLHRALMLRCAEDLPINVNKLNLFHEFRSDRVAKLVTQRAKSILAAGESFFNPDSPHQRIKGPELIERVARVFVDQLLTSEPGQILRLHDAYSRFLALLKERGLPDIKRSDFKAVVEPLIREQFNVALRNDLSADDKQGVRGWKGVKLLQSSPG